MLLVYAFLCFFLFFGGKLVGKILLHSVLLFFLCFSGTLVTGSIGGHRIKMWAAYWGTCKNRAISKPPLPDRLRLLDRAWLPALTYTCPGWAPQRVIALSLDRLQTKMIACMMRVPMCEGESPADYVIRRNLIASRIAGRSTHWYRKSLSWHRHLERKHDHESWAVHPTDDPGGKDAALLGHEDGRRLG